MPGRPRAQPAGRGSVWPRGADETALTHRTQFPCLPVKRAEKAESKCNVRCGLRSVVDQLSRWTAGQTSSGAQRALDLGI